MSSMKNIVTAACAVIVGCALPFAAGAAQQEKYPSKPIRMVAVRGRGERFSGTDGGAELEGHGQQVVITNRPGAGGRSAADRRQGGADGYTVAIIGQRIFQRADPRAKPHDSPMFHVVRVALPNVVVIGNGVPVKNVNDVALAKAAGNA